MDIYSRSSSLEAQTQPFLESPQRANQSSFHFQDNSALAITVPLLSSDNGNKCEGDESDITRLLILQNRSESRSSMRNALGKKGSGDSKMKGSSLFWATLNGMNVLAGLGVLSTPYAVSEGGWLSLSCLVLFAVVCCYTGFLLCRCLDTDPRLMSYPDVGEAAFGRCGRLLVSILLYSELYAVAVELLILEGDNLAQLFPFLHVNIFNISLKAEATFVVLSAIVMLPTVWLRDLRSLAYVSAGGVFASVLVVLAVAYIGITDVGFHYQGKLMNLRSLPVSIGLYAFCYCGHAVFPNIYISMNDKSKFSHLLAYVLAVGVFALVLVMLTAAYIGIINVGFHHQGKLTNLHSLLVSIGLYTFCYCGHVVFPNIYISMNDRSKFSHVLIICFVLCTLIYGGIAVLGYLMFGEAIQSQVTLNLPRGAMASKVAILTTVINPFTKYALTLTPLAYALEEFLPSPRTKEATFCGGIFIRTLLVSSTVVVALVIPFFAYLMAFIGSFLSSTVAMIIPCLCYLQMFKGKLTLGEIILCVLIAFVGFIAAAIGTYSSVFQILNNL